MAPQQERSNCSIVNRALGIFLKRVLIYLVYIVPCQMCVSFFFMPLSFLIWRLNVDGRHREDGVLLVFPTSGWKGLFEIDGGMFFN